MRQRYGARNYCGDRLHAVSALDAVVGLVIWLSSSSAEGNGGISNSGGGSSGGAVASSSSASASSSAVSGENSNSLASWQLATLPETLFVGAVVATVCAAQCADWCCPKHLCPHLATAWVVLLLGAIVLPLIAFTKYSTKCLRISVRGTSHT